MKVIDHPLASTAPFAGARSLLKTKVVATVGAPRGAAGDQVLDPDGNKVTTPLSQGNLLEWFITSGVDVVRINMSFAASQDPYGDNEQAYLEWLTTERNGLARHVAVLGDLPGPKIRLGDFADDQIVQNGDPFVLAFGDTAVPPGEPGASVLVNNQPFSQIVNGVSGTATLDAYLLEQGPRILTIGDGKVQLRGALDAEGARQFKEDQLLRCVVDVDDDGGTIKPRKGLTIKGASLDIPNVFTKEDRRALDFLLQHGANILTFVAVSFVRSQEDILEVKYYLEEALRRIAPERSGPTAPSIIAKIETREACDNIDAILDVADGLMVARGDLGEQLDPWEVPEKQKELIKLCNLRGKPVITATQMLDSMEHRQAPTRAEATDVFNAIIDGTDAVMLSGETSAGRNPVQAIRMMASIAEQAERFIFSKGERQDFELTMKQANALVDVNTKRLNASGARAATSAEAIQTTDAESTVLGWRSQLFFSKVAKSEKQKTTDRICESACFLSESDTACRAIVAPTASGRTARMISRFRPLVPVIGAAHDEFNQRKLILSFGVYPVLIGLGDKNDPVDVIVMRAISEAMRGPYLPWEPAFVLLVLDDCVVATSGTPLRMPGTTNLVQIIDRIQ